MSEEKATSKPPREEEPQKRPPRVSALVRVVNWTAWLPEIPDRNHSEMTLSNGITSFALAPGESIADIEHQMTGVIVKGISEKDDEQYYQLHLFKAIVIAKVPEGQDYRQYVSPQPPRKKSEELIDEFNKAQATQRQLVRASVVPQGGGMRPKR